MILECPQCHTRYLVPDTAIGADGRTVRCATCRHSWFQEGAAIDLPEPGVATAPPTEAVPPPAADPADYDAFAHRPPFRARRNPARMWTLAAVAAGLLMLLGIAAIIYTGAPGIAAQLGLSRDRTLPLQVISDPVQRRELDNGSVLFAVSGRVVNPTGEPQRVPDIRADLLDRADDKGRSVYNWTITPQQRTLPPKGSIEFASSQLDVPANAKQLRLSFVGEGGK